MEPYVQFTYQDYSNDFIFTDVEPLQVFTLDVKNVYKVRIYLITFIPKKQASTSWYYMSAKLPFFYIKEEIVDPINLDPIYACEVRGKSDLKNLL